MINSPDILLDYIRLVSYALILLSALQGILHRRFNSVLFVGDIIMAIGLLLAGLHVNIFGKDGRLFGDIFLTPAAVTWAIIHFYNMLKKTNNI